MVVFSSERKWGDIMSLIVHTTVKSGIIVASDTRTTKKDDKGNVRYDDTAKKTIPFPNQIVVSHCGDGRVSDKLSVADFLLDLRSRLGATETIRSLPLTILSEAMKYKTDEPDITFLVSGYDENYLLNYTYEVGTKNREVKLVRTPRQYGSSYRGQTDIAHRFMDGISYDNLSFEEGILLTKSCVESVISSFRFRPSQSVGGSVDLYVIGGLAHPTGWYQDVNIVPDPDAPDDALDKVRRQRAMAIFQEAHGQADEDSQ